LVIESFPQGELSANIYPQKAVEVFGVLVGKKGEKFGVLVGKVRGFSR
tara:strand:- start:190 stop:333 length:144 start_codon:yes stop_codon:yes gene_type:complete